MNILIVSAKSDAAIYKSIAEKIPGINVLSPVSAVKESFIFDLQKKWNPHAMLIDTDVPSKKTNITDVIFRIASIYPYIRVIVITTGDDAVSYPPSCEVIRGQITNIQLCDKIKAVVSNDTTAAAVACGAQNNADYSGEAITEKLPDKKADNLSTFTYQKKAAVPRKHKLSAPLHLKLFIITAPAAVLLLTAAVVFAFIIKSTANSPAAATADEISQGNTYAIATATQDEVFTTVSIITEPAITEAVTESETPTAYIRDEYVPATTVQPTTEKKSESSRSSSSSASSSSNLIGGSTDNNSKGSETGASSSSSSKSSSTQSQRTNSAVISYEGNQYSNNGSNTVSSIKLSYKSKTMYVGDTLTLTAEVSPASADYNLSWTSTDSTVVTVSNGQLKALKTGSADIICFAGEKTSSCKVTVVSSPSN